MHMVRSNWCGMVCAVVIITPVVNVIPMQCVHDRICSVLSTRQELIRMQGCWPLLSIIYLIRVEP
jgi:hypothetical protein